MDGHDEAHGWLRSLSDTSVAQRLISTTFDPGEVLLVAGDLGDFFLVILEGDADVFQGAEMIATVHAGSLVGELSLLTGTPRTSTVIARTTVHALRGSGHDFVELLEDESIREHFTHLAASRFATNLQAVPFDTPSGFAGELRPLLPSDRPAYLDLLSRLSPESRRLRFFTASLPSEKLINYLIAIDFIDHFAWVVLDRSTTPHQGCGVARLIRSSTDASRAEAAFAVTDEHQGRGIGTIMFGAIGVAARALGVTTLTAQVLDENAAMRRVFDKAKPFWTRPDRGILEAAMPVDSVCALLDADLANRISASVRGLGLAAEIGLRIRD